MRNRSYIEETWKKFEAACIPSDTSPHQRHDIRRAYYVGAHDVFRTLVKQLREGDEPGSEDYAVLDDINDELNGFVEEMRVKVEALRRRNEMLRQKKRDTN